jgi:hypothetical protein
VVRDDSIEFKTGHLERWSGGGPLSNGVPEEDVLRTQFAIRKQIDELRRGSGTTLFEMVVEVFEKHIPSRPDVKGRLYRHPRLDPTGTISVEWARASDSTSSCVLRLE